MDRGDSAGREGKAPKKTMKVALHGITLKPIQVQTFTATGLPAVSSVVLRALAGNRALRARSWILGIRCRIRKNLKRR